MFALGASLARLFNFEKKNENNSICGNVMQFVDILLWKIVNAPSEAKHPMWRPFRFSDSNFFIRSFIRTGEAPV